MFKKINYIKKINSLENENETLKEVIKSELYKLFMNKLGENIELDRLKSENKRLRKNNKILREMLKESK